VVEKPDNSTHHKLTERLPLVVKLRSIGLPIPKIVIDSRRLEADSSKNCVVKTSPLVWSHHNLDCIFVKQIIPFFDSAGSFHRRDGRSTGSAGEASKV
jgi:hypothetical protein